MSDDGSAQQRCPECGTPVAAGKTCRDNFHDLLFLEAGVPTGAGRVAHFYAVASYGLQHADSMGYSADTVEGLRAAVRSVLAGEADTEDIRRRFAHISRLNGRVTRRGDEPAPPMRVKSWPVTVTDVLAGGVESYARNVEWWAQSIIDTHDAIDR